MLAKKMALKNLNVFLNIWQWGEKSWFYIKVSLLTWNGEYIKKNPRVLIIECAGVHILKL